MTYSKYIKIMIINANQPETKNEIVDDFEQEITHSDTYHTAMGKTLMRLLNLT